MIVYSVIFWSSLFSKNLLGHCTCTTIILSYKLCVLRNFMFLASMLQVENKYGDLTILCLEHSIPLHKL